MDDKAQQAVAALVAAAPPLSQRQFEELSRLLTPYSSEEP